MMPWMASALVAGLVGASLACLLVRRHRHSLAVGICLLLQAGMLLLLLVSRGLADATGQTMALVMLGAMPIALLWLSAPPPDEMPPDNGAPPASSGDSP
jgi:NADH:ubiquinone oxidoreductase subunit K